MENTESVKTQTINGVQSIVFHQPKGNCLTGTLCQKLTQSLIKAERDRDINIILLESSGDKTFSAGASFDDILRVRSLEDGKAFFSNIATVINQIRKNTKIIICRVQGKVVGGGVGIVAAADYTFATEAASIRLSELALGIGPFTIGPAVIRKIGLSAFTTLALNPEKWQSAQWAYEKGLYTEYYKSTDEMDKGIETFTGKLAAYNPEALTELKKWLWSGTDNWDNILDEKVAISARLMLSDYTKNAIEKFKMSKRS